MAVVQDFARRQRNGLEECLRLPEWSVRLTRRGAAVVVATAARFRKDPISWTQQQGKADTISGRTITFRNLKRDWLIRSVLQCHSALPFQVSPSRPTQLRGGHSRCD